jgi:hypothetical protein
MVMTAPAGILNRELSVLTDDDIVTMPFRSGRPNVEGSVPNTGESLRPLHEPIGKAAEPW